MALEDLYGKILAFGAKSIRKHTVLPRLINHVSEEDERTGKGFGGTVEVIIPPEMSSRDVVPASTPPASQNQPVPTTKPVPLNFWKEVNFPLSTKHVSLIENAGETIPMFIDVAGATLADELSAYIFSKYKSVYGWAGASGVSPFATSILEAQQAKKILTVQKCPKQMRNMVLDSDGYSNATALQAFRSFSEYGDRGVILEGEINRGYGFDWHEDLNVLTHTTVGAGGTVTGAAGAVSLTISGGTPPVVGDVFTIAGHTQTYSVTSVSGAVIGILPKLQVTVAAPSALTYKASHVVNLAFHPYGFAFASRPAAELKLPGYKPGRTLSTWVDELTGVVIRLEIKDEYHQTGFYMSVLAGCEVADERLITRIAG